MAGLGCGVLAAIPVFLFGGADVGDFAGQVSLILIGFAGQLLAGYVAARLAGFGDAAHGSFAGLGLFAVIAIMSIAAGQQPGVFTLAFSGAVALVLGSAGGVLAAEGRNRREQEPNR